MKSHLFLSAFVLFTVFIFTASAHAATYYISPSDSLTGAISQLRAGDTLYLHGGTYNEPISTATTIPSGTSWSNPVTIAGAPGETATLTQGIGIRDNIDGSVVSYVVFDNLIITNPTSSGFFASNNANHIRVSNSELTNTYTNIIFIGCMADPAPCANNIEFIHNRIHDAPVAFVAAWGVSTGNYGAYVNGHHLLFDGNIIYNNTGYGIHNYHSDFYNVSDNIYRNNIFYHNGFDDGTRGLKDSMAAIIITSGSNNQFYNNIVYGNNNGVQIGCCNNAQVYNNTIYNNGLNGNGGDGISIGAASQNVVLKNNIVYGNLRGQIVDYGAPNPILDHNYTSDPQFINPTGNPPDFHLQSGSPALHASDSGGEVGAYGNGGGPCSTGCPTPTQTPTPSQTPQPTPIGSLCSTLFPGTAIGTGFGTPWNVFNLSELLLKAFCNGPQTTAIMGPSTYVYSQGYAWVNNNWQQTTFTCTAGALVSNAWCPNTAQGTLPQTSTYYVAYTCNWTGSKWNCGCADTNCSTNYWQLQKIN